MPRDRQTQDRILITGASGLIGSRLLEWEPQHRLREALPAMIEFLKQDPRAFYEQNKLPAPEEVLTGD